MVKKYAGMALGVLLVTSATSFMCLGTPPAKRRVRVSAPVSMLEAMLEQNSLRPVSATPQSLPASPTGASPVESAPSSVGSANPSGEPSWIMIQFLGEKAAKRWYASQGLTIEKQL